jgi:predicted alpha-1,2-mannosidase
MSTLKNIMRKMVLSLSFLIVISNLSRAQENSNVKYVDPTIGNVAPLLNTNRPVVHLPNQMVRMFPSRYDHLDLQITGFPLLALNIITPQVIFSVKPAIGEVSDTCWNRRLNYDQDFEITRPWYYSTLITDDNIRTEYTAGERTGIYRFTFPKGVKKNLMLSHCYAEGLYDLGSKNDIYGTEFVVDEIHQQKGTAYMYGAFTGTPRSGKSQGEKDWGKYSVGWWGGAKPTKMNGEKVWISYSENDPSVIEFRYAISFISREQARKNFEELNGVTFEALSEKGKSAWVKVMDQIKVEGGTESQRRTFYTALYRCYPRMTNITEDGKYFSGYDKKVHEDKRPFYVDDYSWGNFLALHPLYIILNPEREADMLQSYVRMYQESGWIPDYPKHFGDREGMFSFHSAVMFLDAYRKGVRNFDVNKAFEGMLKSQEQATMLPSRNGPKGALEDFYNEKGYYPGLHPGEKETDPTALGKRGQKRSSVAITLGHSTDAWALSEMAKELSKPDIAARFGPKAQNYKNLWNAESKFFLPKDANGEWIKIDPQFPFDPKFPDMSSGDYYNENSGWIYLFNVQHDVEGLIGLMGGEKNFEQRLDQLFTERLGRGKAAFFQKFPDQTGLIGNYGLGNQVSFLIPYLYNYTGSPWKTQKMTRLLLDTWFKDDIFGVPGDEDAGAMSSFVVFTAMGFYPAKPGIPMYTITSPVFSKVSISLPNGKTFTLIANNSSRTNKYIQSAKLNGKTLTTPWFSHDDLVKGGTIVLEMGEKPGIIWSRK